MSYADDLKHPKWQRKRLEIMKRDGWKCTGCHSEDKQLHVHHKRYIAGRKPWEYADTDLDTYCHDCHDLYHAAMDHYSDMQWENKLNFWGSLIPESAERFKVGPFIIFPSPKLVSGWIIIHVPTSYWHEFSLPPSQAVEVFHSRPDSRQELLEIILKGASAEWKD